MRGSVIIYVYIIVLYVQGTSTPTSLRDAKAMASIIGIRPRSCLKRARSGNDSKWRFEVASDKAERLLRRTCKLGPVCDTMLY